MTLRVISGGGEGPGEVVELAENVLVRAADKEMLGLIVIAVTADGIDLSHTTMTRNELHWHLQKVALHVLAEE